MHWPGGGLDTGRDVDRLTANIDILPTLIELCGLDSSGASEFDGRSLVPLLHNVDHSARSSAAEAAKTGVDGAEDDGAWSERAIVTDTQRLPRPIKWRRSAVMTDCWRLVGGSELYDIGEDQEQRSDVAARHPDVVADLRQAMRRGGRRFRASLTRKSR